MQVPRSYHKPPFPPPSIDTEVVKTWYFPLPPPKLSPLATKIDAILLKTKKVSQKSCINPFLFPHLGKKKGKGEGGRVGYGRIIRVEGIVHPTEVCFYACVITVEVALRIVPCGVLYFLNLIMIYV